MMIPVPVIEAFRSTLRGELILPDDASYDAARQIHNAFIDRRPAMIVRCAGVADVMAALGFARDRHLTLAIHSAGHNVAGLSMCDGGMVVDLSRMKSIRVDPKACIARVEPGVRWSELGHELQRFGLAATGGFIGTTGVSGLTLGGGLGWMVRKHGLALDNLLSADVVTADGALQTVSEHENPELFWAIRGGGGNFGIVTSLEFRVHPAGIVLAGLVMYPGARGSSALRFWREFEDQLTEDATLGAFIFRAPPAMPVPEALRRDFIVGLGGVYVGPLEQGRSALKPLREFGPPVLDTFQEMPYSAAQVMADFLTPPGRRNYWKSGYMKELADKSIDTMLRAFASVPSPLTMLFIEHDGDGAASRVPESATAFPNRRWPYNFGITSIWEDPARDEENMVWTRDLWNAMQPWLAADVYVNYLGEEGEERVRSAYGANYARLVELKNKYDPDNVFCFNQNIRPDPRAAKSRAG